MDYAQTPTDRKKFDLEERTFEFAKNVRNFLNAFKPMEANQEDKKQLFRSSGSVAANYIEANESISKKDFALRIKICRKEAKESCLWLRLLQPQLETSRQMQLHTLIQEALELTKIFSAIAKKAVNEIV